MKKIRTHPEWAGTHRWAEIRQRESGFVKKIKGGACPFTNGVAGGAIPGLGPEFQASIQSTGGYIGESHGRRAGASDTPSL